MTRLISVKSVNELPESFKDKVELQVIDNAIEAVILNIDGQSIRIVGTDTYSKNVKILTAEPKKEVIQYQIEGSVGDLKIVPETYETEYEAIDAKNKYESKFNYETDLKIVPVISYVEQDKIQ